MTEDEIRADLKKYKEDHPEIDWDVFDAYAVVNDETGKVERTGVIRRDRLIKDTLSGQNR